MMAFCASFLKEIAKNNPRKLTNNIFKCPKNEKNLDLGKTGEYA
jgi:hypothetical protein